MQKKNKKLAIAFLSTIFNRERLNKQLIRERYVLLSNKQKHLHKILNYLMLVPFDDAFE